METTIVAQVARILMQEQTRESKKKDSTETVVPASSVNLDTVSFSDMAKSNSASGLSSFDLEHQQNVERVKSLTQNNRYEMTDSMRDAIAGRIAKMFT